MKKNTTSTLLIFLCLICFGCTKADLKFKSLKSDSSSTTNQTAPPNFQISAGTTNLSAGSFKIRGQVNNKQFTLLSAGGYKLYGEIVK